jgi:hypothetical protein
VIKGLILCHRTCSCVHSLCLCPAIGAGAASGASGPGHVPSAGLAAASTQLADFMGRIQGPEWTLEADEV